MAETRRLLRSHLSLLDRPLCALGWHRWKRVIEVRFLEPMTLVPGDIVAGGVTRHEGPAETTAFDECWACGVEGERQCLSGPT